MCYVLYVFFKFGSSYPGITIRIQICKGKRKKKQLTCCYSVRLPHVNIEGFYDREVNKIVRL